MVHRLADGVDPGVITTAEAAAGSVPGVIHAHPRARWTGHTLRAEIEGWADPELPGTDAGAIGRLVAGQITPEATQARPPVGAWFSRTQLSLDPIRVLNR